MTLNLGTSKIDITPSVPIELAGFAHRKGPYSGIKKPLYLRAFYFEKERARSKKDITIMITADLIWWEDEHCKQIEQQIKKELTSDFIIIFHATHNHSGPQTSNTFTRFLGVPDPCYLENLNTQVLVAIKSAVQNLEPVTLSRGFTTCNIGINRRLLSGTKVRMAPNEDGPLDSDVTILVAENSNGNVKGVMVHYTCHPTITGDNYISSEFPGVATEEIERVLGEKVVAGYFQGCCGDIRPAMIDKEKNEFYRGNQTDVQRLGQQLADQVIKAISEKKLEPLNVEYMQIQKRSVPLKYEKVPSINELQSLEESLTKDEHVVWKTFLLENRNRLSSEATLELMLVEFGDDLSFLAMNAEMVVEYSRFIKKEFPNKVLPLPYSNGMIGYIPTSQQIIEGGYESKEWIYFFGVPSHFSISIEENIQQGIRELIMKGDC
ncbi:neutral/alkaline non-lysosomal ceramidase N-terminal domain-containing protein [Pseudalkalibacillus salsuginis]|uniref:neutral/alkaline non-lysosomal ceramidase N-terminal domain-containing protein n=1 Tax=Pseudalkalibacillus salsuginis TaxID=2910972 RepID=UPI001F1C2690|nr:neutral/alkaline non-lysosomal ceramidase N-terminal domain-containing protein [Pseudalkalibacillus salsuginis]MCF6411605.1 neutral/alkaline non-lysosomal ceramidase N-terminal domain-containing protein [Pseudalkalibacillus salsuginis]